MTLWRPVNGYLIREVNKNREISRYSLHRRLLFCVNQKSSAISIKKLSKMPLK